MSLYFAYLFRSVRECVCLFNNVWKHWWLKWFVKMRSFFWREHVVNLHDDAHSPWYHAVPLSEWLLLCIWTDQCSISHFLRIYRSNVSFSWMKYVAKYYKYALLSARTYFRSLKWGFFEASFPYQFKINCWPLTSRHFHKYFYNVNKIYFPFDMKRT